MMNRRGPSKFATGVVALGASVMFAIHVLMPFSANAQISLSPIPPIPATPVMIQGNTYQEIQKALDRFDNQLVVAGVVALMNAFQSFSQRIAYDAAQRILTGDKGQYPMFWEDKFGDYIATVGLDAGNQFISSINSDIFNPLGFDLCKPIDPFSLQLAFGISPPSRLQPTCTAAQIGSAFEQTREAFSTDKEVYEVIASMFNPQANELSVSLQFHNQYLDAIVKEQQAAILDRRETEGLKQVQDIISGKITTPGQVVKDTLSATNVMQRLLKGQDITYDALMGQAFELGFSQLAILTASTFLGTLANGAIQKLFEGLKSGPGGGFVATGVDLINPDSAGNRNVAEARIVFSDLLTPNLFSTDQQDFVNELAGCPTPRGIWNCAMDDALAAALRSSGETGAYSVGRASHVVLNGLPPSNSQFLHPDWELIPDSEVKDNTDPSCYQRAYCASNLAKLRYARILPVGWELAANSPYNKKKNGRYITLGEVIRGFSVCNDKGAADSSHPWCKLIDPNWILTAPPFQCRVKGFGDQLFSGTAIRLQDCADAVSCLKRDDGGKCTGGYGYCLAEKPVWRFSSDECLDRFASCRTYQNRAGTQVSYLRNTIDYGSCSADNVGCMWYSTARDPADTSGSVWIGQTAPTSGPRLYADATMKPCSASNDGCTKLLEVKPAESSLNLIPNGSFERLVPNSETVLLNWSFLGVSPAPEYVNPSVSEGSSVFEGGQSYLPFKDSTHTLSSARITIVPLRNYTLSAYIRNTTSTEAGSVSLKLSLFKGPASSVLVDAGPYYRSGGCTSPQNEAPGFVEALPAGAGSEAWRRVQCSFVANEAVGSGRIDLVGEGVVVDAIQLEETEVATSFVDGLSANMSVRHLKVAPPEYACQGTKADHPMCAGYARVCRQMETGCQGYRDTGNPNAPEIPATLSAVDICPAACVGYAEYRKQPSTFDLGKSTDERLNDPQDDTVANFVPSYAEQCTLQDVGCEEFTNVEASAEGGEQKQYFNYIRACEKPGAESETFFTWEGSETTGYQLRTWSLIHDPLKNPRPPKIVQKVGPEGVLKDPDSCSDAYWRTGIDPDCRQIFNANGDVFYAYFSQTVVSSPACTNFRLNRSNTADCAKTGGSFNPASGECIYQILQSESRQCGDVNAGCRAYMGTASRNTVVAFEENFHTTSTAKFSSVPSGQLSNESVLVGDKSLLITGAGDLSTATAFPSFTNQLYSVSFWAKTTSPAQSESLLFVDGKQVASFTMESDWRRYEFGPFSTDSTVATSTIQWINLPNATFLDEIRIERLNDIFFVKKDSWTIPSTCDRTPEGLPQPQAMLGCRAYQDRDGANVTVRRFGHLCREEAIGCKQFVTTQNSDDPYAQTFVLPGTDLNAKVTPEASKWEAQYLGTATTTRPADAFVYLIDEPRARCDASQQSCRAFGKPKFRQDFLELESPSSSKFETVYMIDDITKYVTSDGEPNMLCRKDELFCDEFKSGRTVAYFRNPQNHACEWKDKVLLKKNEPAGIPADGEYTGWFRTETDIPCYAGSLSSGNTYLIQNSGDAGYTGWAATCPVEQSECTEFRDPNDHSDPIRPSGKPYYFIKNQRLDVRSCSGKVDLLSGCILFRDLSDTRMRYNTTATYRKSSAEGDTPQAPIDCIGDPSNPYCKGAGRCQITWRQWVTSGGVTSDPAKIPSYVKLNDKVSCSVDEDCAAYKEYGIGQGEPPYYDSKGTCVMNDANVIMKVKLDRDCAQWLGCASGETVYDPVQQKYVDLCTELAMCDVSKGSNAGSFCANYVDRNKDPILKPGAFFDRELYTRRETGFGKSDYSGYAVPDQFQAADIQNRRVAQELFEESPDVANRYAQDYRLTAAVLESATNTLTGTSLVEFPADEGEPVNELYPNLKICKHTQTGRTGYFVEGGEKGRRVCYFPVDALSTRSVDVLVDPLNPTSDPRNIEPLSDLFRQSKDPENDKVLQRSFPPAECKAYPEGDSPFPNLYVKEWDYTTKPFKKAGVVQGYENVNLCEWGEDCACSYRKVKYGGQVTKYVSPFGAPPPGGICSGGSKNGEACAPGQHAGSAPDTDALIAQATTQDIGCPGGGRCLPISDVVLVRGQFGQCLQRDYSRSVAGDPGRHPCLVWNPNPILASTYDTSHYLPTAGYQPPVNAGEYYCLSHANAPFESVWSAESTTYWSDSGQPGSADGVSVGDGANQFFYLPAKLSKLNYDTGYIAGQCGDTGDECGDLSEFKCNCHDGIGNVESVGYRDFEAMSRAVRAKDAGAQQAFDDANTSVFGGSAEGEAEECLKGPQLCWEAWRAVILGKSIDGYRPLDAGLENPQADRCLAARTGGDEDVDAGNYGGPGRGGVAKDGIGAFDKAPDADFSRGRWIQTGRGLGRTYMEYFVPVKPQGVAKWLNPGRTDPNATVVDDVEKSSVLERNFAQFQFFATGDDFSIACSLPPEYVEGVSVTDWNDFNQVSAASKQALTQFSRDFDGQLDRSKEKIIVNKAGKPLKETCSGYNDGTAPAYAGSDGRCYYKTWETNYRLDGSPTFEWLNAESGTSLLERHSRYYSHERSCSKSGFAIRAVFENADKAQNDIPASEAVEGQLAGPWNFVGFWITSCLVGHDMESHLYLSLRVKHADVCTQLAQVIAPYSRESAAFADRVWANGGFVLPQLGYSYSSNNPPFGSAMTTALPGIEPLFQTGGPVENYSQLNPPTFLGSGVSFTSLRPSPVSKWSYLTNVFARVYRIYTYYDSGVSRDGYACIGGPNHGALCPTPSTEPDQGPWLAKVKEICGGEGLCDTTVVPVLTKNKVHRCNGLSGVNAGLECGGGLALASLDTVCHNAPMKNVGGALVPQLSECKPRSGWKTNCDSPGQYRSPNADMPGGNHPDYSKNTCYNVTTAHEKFNAFGCADDAVLAGAGCSVPETQSKDCPKKVVGGQDSECIDDTFGPMRGHCSNGYEHARCDEDSECAFGLNQWWGAHDTGLPKGYEADPAAEAYEADPANGSAWLGKGNLWTYFYPSNGAGRVNAWMPTPAAGGIWKFADPNTLYRSTPYVHAGASRFGGLVDFGSTDQRLKRWPSAHPVYANPNDTSQPLPYYRPGLCEGAQGARQDPEDYWGFGEGTSDLEKKTRTFEFYTQPLYALQVGQCAGGSSAGQFCFNSSTIPVTSDWPHPNTCAPPQGTAPGVCKNVANKQSDGSYAPIIECASTLGGDPFSTNPDADNNSCTRSAGYRPDPDVCGKNPDNEKCLLGYDLRTSFKQDSLNQTKKLGPTDVTSGFHSPIFLGLSGGNPDDYRHIAHYAPRPPTIAAPDLTRTCESPGQCRISKVGGFTLEDQSEGPIVYGGGKAQVTMRFYGWADHDQTPLKSLYIDWGDGSITKIEDVRMKNKKPFCGGTRECELVPGLTCNSDSDCPPAGGKCVDIGTCAQDPGKRCSRNSECQVSGKPDDKCVVRPFFGNSDDACEANYFEFTHAYTCNEQLKTCGTTGRCSRNPDIECSNASACGVGDTCIQGLAPSSDEGVSGGCFDSQKVSCRYTPKIMLVDSWNWCTGECRAGALVGNTPNDATGSKVKHVYGGCWDGTETKRNTNDSQSVMTQDQNECILTPSSDKNIRPWIVYPGSVQIGSYK